MNKDIKALLSIYTILILIGWNIALNHKANKEFKEKIEAIKVAINLNKANDNYIEMLDSMNEYTDSLENEIEQSKLIKDLR